MQKVGYYRSLCLCTLLNFLSATFCDDDCSYFYRIYKGSQDCLQLRNNGDFHQLLLESTRVLLANKRDTASYEKNPAENVQRALGPCIQYVVVRKCPKLIQDEL